VYPPYLPYLHISRRLSRRWIAPAFALAAIGIGITALRQARREHAQRLVAAARIEEDAKRRKNKMLMEAYGGRMSLNELEEAVKVYENIKS
jgi:hypothetical protein